MCVDFFVTEFDKGKKFVIFDKKIEESKFCVNTGDCITIFSVLKLAEKKKYFDDDTIYWTKEIYKIIR